MKFIAQKKSKFKPATSEYIALKMAEFGMKGKQITKLPAQKKCDYAEYLEGIMGGLRR